VRTVPVHRSLYRRILILGGERDLVQLAAFIAFLVGVGGMTLASFIAGGLFWLISIFCLQRMAKADVYMGQVFERHVRQQDFYPARTSVWRGNR